MNVFFYTLGCKVNQYESQEMAELLENNGYTIIYNISSADIVIVNSCTVTAESVRKTRQAIRRYKKKNPNCTIVLTGCAPQAEPHIVNDLPEVDILIGNRNNTQLIDALNEYFKSREFLNCHKEHKTGEPLLSTGITRFDGHTRAFLKIQDGCDRFCTYCLIPYARGRSRSKSLDDIDRELSAIAKNGYKEVVFVGINLSDYGKNTPYSLPDALLLAEKYDTIKRIRLGSLEPDHMNDEMIDRLGKITKLCPQFHISLQSGCDNVLKKMNRHYTADEYYNLCLKLRKTFEDATITTDILVGFPNESEEDFSETVKFAEKIKFEKVHVFPYSVRKGTKAENMPQIDKSIKEARARHLSDVTDKIRREYLNSQIDKTVEVLFELNKNGVSVGYTKNYTPVKVYTNEDYRGTLKPIKIIDADNDFCIGQIV